MVAILTNYISQPVLSRGGPLNALQDGTTDSEDS